MEKYKAVNRHIDVKRITILALLLAVSVVLGYVESLIPYDFGVPGIKLGLANVVSLLIIYTYKSRDAFLVGILRVLIIGFLFGNLSMIIYSLSGLIFSIIMMIFFKKVRIFGIIGVSVIGAVFHNIGQLIVAYFVVRSVGVLAYIPVLLIAAVIAGVFTGVAASSVLKFFMNNESKGD